MREELPESKNRHRIRDFGLRRASRATPGAHYTLARAVLGLFRVRRPRTQHRNALTGLRLHAGGVQYAHDSAGVIVFLGRPGTRQGHRTLDHPSNRYGRVAPRAHPATVARLIETRRYRQSFWLVPGAHNEAVTHATHVTEIVPLNPRTGLVCGPVRSFFIHLVLL